jgi:hypothetical protein
MVELEIREHKRFHLSLILTTIRNVYQIIILEKNNKLLLDKACKLLVETNGFHRAGIVLVEDDKLVD